MTASSFSSLAALKSILGNGLALEANLRYSRQHEDLQEDEGGLLLRTIGEKPG